MNSYRHKIAFLFAVMFLVAVIGAKNGSALPSLYGQSNNTQLPAISLQSPGAIVVSNASGGNATAFNPFDQNLNRSSNVTFNIVNASYFVGDGSRLTNLSINATRFNPFNQDLNTTNNVQFRNLSLTGNLTVQQITELAHGANSWVAVGNFSNSFPFFGGQSAPAKFVIYNENTTAFPASLAINGFMDPNSGGVGTNTIYFSARGNLTNQAALVNGDMTGGYIAFGYNGSDYQLSSYITNLVDPNNPNLNVSLPGAIAFTTADDTGVVSLAMWMNSLQNVGIKETALTPNQAFTVGGNANITQTFTVQGNSLLAEPSITHVNIGNNSNEGLNFSLPFKLKAKLNVFQDGQNPFVGDAFIPLMLSSFSNVSAGSGMVYTAARGNMANPEALQPGDAFYFNLGFGWNGTEYIQGSTFGSRYDNSEGDNNATMPSGFSISTHDVTGSGIGALSISPNGSTVLGPTSVNNQSRLTVDGKITGIDLVILNEAQLRGVSNDGVGKVVCVNAAGNLGTCSSIVGVTGLCTCT